MGGFYRPDVSPSIPYLVYDARICLLGAAEGEVEGVQQPREEGHGVALLRDLKLLLRAEHDGLQHLVGADVRLEVLRVPQLPYQLAKPLRNRGVRFQPL